MNISLGAASDLHTRGHPPVALGPFLAAFFMQTITSASVKSSTAVSADPRVGWYSANARVRAWCSKAPRTVPSPPVLAGTRSSETCHATEEDSAGAASATSAGAGSGDAGALPPPASGAVAGAGAEGFFFAGMADVTWEDTLRSADQFLHSSGAWTTHKQIAGLRQALDGVRKVTNVFPLAPHPMYPQHPVQCTWVPHYYSAIRDPTALLDAWTAVCIHTARIAGPGVVGEHVVCSGDGLADKAGIYHMGFHFGHDPHVMSGYAQRDFIIGPLNEKNQWHALLIAKAVAALRQAVLARGGLFVHSGDWESIKCMARGLCWGATGFFIKDPNQGVLSAYLWLHQARSAAAALVPTVADVAILPVAAVQIVATQILGGVCGTEGARKLTFNGIACLPCAISAATSTATLRPGMGIPRSAHPVSGCWAPTIAIKTVLQA